MELGGTVTGVAQRLRGAVVQAVRAVLERADVVMSQQVGEVVAPLRERLDPLGRAPMLLCALSSRDLAIGDVTDEHVAERVLVLSAHG